MKLSRLKKTVAASGIALFFTFGALAVSLAYEAVAIGSPCSCELHYLLSTGAGPLYTSLVAPGLQLETAYLTESPRPCSQAHQVTKADWVELLRPCY